MFSFCRDIAFAEQPKKAGYADAGVLIFADDKNFWTGGGGGGGYEFFRASRPLNGLITKPTGARDDMINIAGNYIVEWEIINDDLRCAIVAAQWRLPFSKFPLFEKCCDAKCNPRPGLSKGFLGHFKNFG